MDEVLPFNVNLTPVQKAVVEFMGDGPVYGQAGHWLTFAKAVSRARQEQHRPGRQIVFCRGNVAFDAFISSWDTKRQYDSSRPRTWSA